MARSNVAPEDWRDYPCKIWTGATMGKPEGPRYGARSIPGTKKMTGAHRYALVLKLGRELKPKHCATYSENQRDMISKNRHPAHMKPRSQCKHGHLFDAKNTRIDPKSGKKACKTCSRENMRRYRAIKNA